MATNSNHRAAVDRIRQDNERDFGPQARRAVQRMLDPTLPRPWMYVYELMQNAVDAGARRVYWRTDGDGVQFQHDGNIPLDETHVRGIASLGASTKGLAAVGFMGIGFKSVFARFREARVSGFGWRFRFDIRVRRGDLESTITEWFDTLRPHWDSDALRTDEDYSTGFFLGRPANRDRPIASDLEEITSLRDPTPLAVLALRGLTQVRVDDEVWDIASDDGIVSLRHSEHNTAWRWKAFVATYRPNDAAMRQFLEARQELQDQTDHQGQRVPRRVVGLLPLDEEGLPQPPRRGRVYSTLPTQARAPLGLHLQADWLLDVDRQDLREVEGNPWQEAIVGRMPDLVRQLFVWLTNASDEVRSRGYRALCDPGDDDSPLAGPFRGLRDDLRRMLVDQPIVPVHGVGPRQFRRPDQVARLPGPFREPFGSRWRPDVLFGLDLMDETILGQAAAFARWLGWGREVVAGDTRWEETLPRWWSTLPKDQQVNALFMLWKAVGESEWDDLPVVPTEAGGWRQASSTVWLNEPPPTEKEPGGAAVAAALTRHLPRAGERLPAGLRSQVDRANNRVTQWLKGLHREVTLSAVVQCACEAADDPGKFPLVELVEWAMNRGDRRQDLVPFVLTAEGARTPTEALLADPLVPGGRSRRLLFPNRPALVAEYSEIGDQPGVVLFLERLGILGGGVLEERREWLSQGDWKRVASLVEVDVSRAQDANRSGYEVNDHHFPFKVQDVPPEALQDWMSREYAAFRDKGRRSAYSSYYGPQHTRGEAAATWVRELQDHPWLLCRDGERRRPAETLIGDDPDFSDAPIADLDAGLASRLEAEGLRFGGNLPKSPVLRRLELRGATDLPATVLASLLQEAREHVEAGEATQEELRRALAVVKLKGVPLLSRVVQRAGASRRQRSDLGGWVVALSDLDTELAEAVVGLPLAVPETTTGRQALDFLRDVWERKPSRVESLRASVGAAYRYVLDDLDSGLLPADEWHDARAHAYLYGGRTWLPIGPTLAVDDVQSPLIHQFLTKRRLVVASAHLGDTTEQVRRVANALGVGLLSDDVSVEPGVRIDTPPWASRLQWLVDTLARLEDRRPLHDVTFHAMLSLQVCGQRLSVQAYVKDGTLMLIDDPSAFSVEAAGQLVDYFQLGQRGNEIPWLTGTLLALKNDETFSDSLHVLANGLGVDLPDRPPYPPTPNKEPSPQPSPGANSGGTLVDPHPDAMEKEVRTHGRSNGARERVGPSRRGAEGVWRVRQGRGCRAADHLKAIVMMRPRGESSGTRGDHSDRGARRDDYPARQAVIHYEMHRGRRPEEMEGNHPGFDVLSIDDATGHRRRIEVKGVQGIFEAEASVALSARQVNDAIQHDEEGVEYWLYVVDSTETSHPRVFPIRWARHPALLRYGFYAWAWVDEAEGPAVVTAQDLTDLAVEELDPLDEGDLDGTSLSDDP